MVSVTALTRKEQGGSILFSQLHSEIVVMSPLETNSLAVNVSLELAKQALISTRILNALEVVSHLAEKLLLVDSAIQLPKSLVTLVVSDSAIGSTNIPLLEIHHLPGFLRIKNTKTIRVVEILILQLVKLRGAQVVDHQSATWSHEVRPHAVQTRRNLSSISVSIEPPCR
jgi:hypothetical protein